MTPPELATCPCCGTGVDPKLLADAEEIADATVLLDMPRASAIFFVMLWRANGRVITYETFFDMHERLTGRYCTSDGVRSVKKRLMPFLKDKPVDLITIYGLGYRLKRLDPTWDWHNLPLH